MKGPHVLWHRNVLGLSMSRVFHFLPVNLRDQIVAFAWYRPSPGEAFKIIFRTDRMAKPAQIELSIQLSQVVAVERRTDLEPIQTTEMSEGPNGWHLEFHRLDTDLVIFEPGVYKVYLASDCEELYLGEVTIFNAERQPFSADEIAAIRSNPFGSKLIRMAIKCNFCGSELRCYAGLQRDAKLESEGFTWNLDIQRDRFQCQCGAHDFSLRPIKNGLHGALQQSFARIPRDADLSSVSSVRLYEDSVIQEYCRQFKELIDSRPGEQIVQTFLEKHEIFFSAFMPKRLMVKPPILTEYFADFAILNERKELLLIEIERPGLLLLRRDGVVTADLQHAYGQVQDWCRVFDDHRAAALDAWGLHLEDVAKVRGVVIAGRTPANEDEERRLRSENRGDIEFYTHDDLLKGVVGLVRHVANA